MSEQLVRDWKLMFIGRLLSVLLNILDCNVFMQLILYVYFLSFLILLS